MAWAIFHKPFNFDYRPLKAVSQLVQPSPEPQQFPECLIEAAVAKGVATRVESPKADEARQYKRSKRTRKHRTLETGQDAH